MDLDKTVIDRVEDKQLVWYNDNNNVRSSIRNIGCLQIFSSLLGSWR
jgi:hypothetical protein